MFLLAKYGTQTTFYFPIVKRGVVDLAATADWTPAAGDTKVSKDGGAVANTTNNPAAVTGTGSVLWSLTLTAAELSAGDVTVQIVDSATKAVEDQVIKIYTYGNASAKIPIDLSDTVRLGLTALPAAAASAAGGLPTVGTGANQITLAAGAVTVGTNNDKAGYTASTVTDKTGYSLSAAGVQAIWDALTTALTTVGSIGKRIADYLTGDAYARLGAPAGASVSADIAAIQADTNDIQTRLPAALVGGKIDATLAATERTAIADAVLDRDMSVGTDSGSSLVRTVRQALRVNRNKIAIAAGTMTVYKEDDVTASFTSAVTTTAGNPISTIDPA